MLYVCPTPIGNLGDITLRVLEALRAADLIAAEDTRRTRKLLSHFEISKPLVSFYEHNELKRAPEILKRLERGENVALVSDAGMPGICDPGYRLIKAALDSGLDVEVLPGPSAIETALVSSGFAPDAFLFLGYMPRKKNDVRATLKNILMQTVTCIAFETPHRLPATLAIASEVLGDRHIAICRELTKKFAEIKRGPGTELLKSLPDSIKGEIVLVFAGGPPVEENDAAATDKAVHALQQLLAAGVSPRSAAETVSSLTGLPKNKSYDLALEIRKRG